MNRLPIILVALGAFAAGAAGAWLVARRAAPPPHWAANTAPSARKVLYWYDPMKPQQHFDAPGKSPYMDMQLVPKYASDAAPAGAGGTGADAGIVRVDPHLAQSLGIRTATAERGTLTHDVHATGTLAFDERATAVVQSRVAGIVEKLWVRAPLTAVRRGERLATLLAPDWTAAQEEYLSLQRMQSAQLDALRAAARQRLVLLGMDEAQIRAIERSGRAQTRITVAAPRDGVVTELSVRDGATVMAGAPLMTLNGFETVWMNAAVPETDSGQVVAGATATATLAAFPGESFDGRVETLLPELDPVTHTQKARIVLPNPRHRLAPGMFADVQIAPPSTGTPTIVIPAEAVIATGTRNVVIVAAGQGRFRAQEVRVGRESGDRVQILDGLSEGDAVVLSGQFLIDSEASLTGALARLGNQDASTTPAPAATAMAPPAQHEAGGTLERIDGRRWTIVTDALPALGMGAMTMTFVGPVAPPPGVAPGRRVRFAFFRNADGEFEIARVAAAAHANDGDDAPAPAQERRP